MVLYWALTLFGLDWMRLPLIRVLMDRPAAGGWGPKPFSSEAQAAWSWCWRTSGHGDLQVGSHAQKLITQQPFEVTLVAHYPSSIGGVAGIHSHSYKQVPSHTFFEPHPLHSHHPTTVYAQLEHLQNISTSGCRVSAKWGLPRQSSGPSGQ